MVSLRRAKLKAKRAGVDIKKVDKCNSIAELEKLISKELKKEVAKDGISE